METGLVNICDITHVKPLSKIYMLELSKFQYTAPDLLSTGVSNIFQINFFNDRNITYTY